MEYGLIGERLGHSFSKVIHENLEDYTYELHELAREDFPAFMEARDFKAINVTIPYKSAVIPYLDEVDPVAAEIGAVNTVVHKEGKLYGYNTDFLGLRDLILKNSMDFKGQRVLILGSGGTAGTAGYTAEFLGANEVVFLGREGSASLEKLKTQGKTCMTYGQAETEGIEASYLINTTPAGMYPDNEGCCPLDITKVQGLLGVVDVIFNPLRTNLVLEAQKMGLAAEGGLYMLVSQAVHAIEYFLDKQIPVSEIDRVYREVYEEKENLVLLGMPGSGKTTLGKYLHIGKEFVDSDWVIEEEYGPIPELFQEYKEEGFRDRETAVLKELAKKNGMLIACGGGAILRQENLKALRQNGRLFFLDRPLEEIRPTSDRPLAQDMEALRARYQERYPIYVREADEIIKVTGTVEESIKQVKERYYENFSTERTEY